MLAEAAVLVPYWQSLSATEFFEWYSSNASRLVDFYTPLEVGSAIAALARALMVSRGSRRGADLWRVAAILAIAVIAMFFVYFKDANASFLDRTIEPNDLAEALQTWANWQWARVALGCAAFVSGAVALSVDSHSRR